MNTAPASRRVVVLVLLVASALALAVWLPGLHHRGIGSTYVGAALAGGWAVAVAVAVGGGATRRRGIAVALAYATAVFAARVSWPLVGLLLVSLGLVGAATPWRMLPWLGVPAVLVAAAAVLALPRGGPGAGELVSAQHLTMALLLPVMVFAGRAASDRSLAAVAQARTMAELVAANRELRRRSAEGRELAVLRERSRLARELHDTLGHALSAITVEVEAARRVGDRDPDRADGLLRDVQSGAREAMRDLREHLAALGEPRVGGDVAGALRVLAEEAARRNDWVLDLHLERVEAPPPVRHALLQIGREALTNAERHAGARRVWMALSRTPEGLCLDVRDDGRGFDAGVPADGHLGLPGMRERAAELGGTLRTESALDQGTRVTAVIPARGGAAGGA